MKEFEEKSLSEILVDEDKSDVELYHKIIEDLATNRVSREIVEYYKGEPISEIYNRIMEAEQEITSDLLFPGSLVLLYPRIEEHRARDYITCDFSAGLIYPKSLYLSYRPLIENLTTGEVYVLKRTLKVESGHYTDLPTTIQEFEGLELKIQQQAPFDDSRIDYSHLSQRTKGGLILQKLKRRVFHENRSC